MNRTHQLQQLDHHSVWDFVIIGGGATGLGAAVDSASRGFKTLLLEKHDFASGTSSRSTKLVHGGVRYLQQGNIKLVMEALRERGLLLQNAPHLVHNQAFLLPSYKWWETPFYGIGLKIYDWMAGKLGLGASRFLSKEETLKQAPTLNPEELRGAILYHDGQFDDARLAIDLAQTASAHQAVLFNYFPVTALLKSNQKVEGVVAIDEQTKKQYHIKARVVINATGVFTDDIMNMDDPDHETMISPSQGIHLVVDKEFLPGNTAVLIPRTDDGRVLFAVPWHDKVVLGTTDTPVDHATTEPIPQEEEIGFILKHTALYLSRDPQRSDIRSMFAGLRPLVKGKTQKTAALSRDHLIMTSASGLITITGGKWTTYRKMAEDLINLAIKENGLEEKKCITKTLKLFGYDQPVIDPRSLSMEDIAYCVRNEMCLTVEDYLSRRTRHLLLDARSAVAAAPGVATAMASLLEKDAQWIADQLKAFDRIATQQLPS
ncbi:glycerol-3-phosphate dehydrogenase/oxidase [Terrimonas sp. NA20]|uniref:Glycerol-3-phosphate dehydrogenase/oxidase n=1 Tax=Terrimonas ginsenosidimutans TaxID=2908004 RepID=A0ABS9KZW6_9BACT|nr:glycerol-3-phosphate dehydrogenase/oxidase [Terrimonas ginsenosidimutans]MCG2617886.1 glycerol-3-phosphate dehydrogenase/oxidase [Terrimonas ginsenosidimutans]